MVKMRLKSCTTRTSWKYLILLLSISYHTVASNPLYKCGNFIDTRYMDSSDYNLTTIILKEKIDIPSHLMSTGLGENNTFGLMNSSQPLHCGNGIKTIFTLLLISNPPDVVVDVGVSSTNVSQNQNANDTSFPISVNPRETRAPNQAVKQKLKLHDRIRGKIGPHFTPEGNLEYDHFIYNPQEFCISRISDTEMDVEICPANCGQSGTACLPKCCGVGEVLVYWKWTCQKVSDSWSPYLYEDDIHTKVPQDKLNSIKIYYHRPYLVNCTNMEIWPSSKVERPMKNASKPPDMPYFFRIRKDGQIMHLRHTRKWGKLPEGRFCIDGFLNWGVGGSGNYVRDEDHQLILLCPSNSTIKKLVKQVSSFYDDIYAGVLYASSMFILLTAVIHMVLYDKQNIHGLTILSQAISLFFFYISYGTAYIVAQRRSSSDNRSPACLTIAIVSHFFFLTTFSWLTVVNFDLWLTFRSLRPVSKMSGKMRRFRLYSFIGWGIPLILMSIFVFLDFYYSDSKMEVKVPDYGRQSCYVASWARQEYICSVLTAVIPINLILIVSTFKTFYDFKQGKTGIVMPKRAKGDQYSFKLFLKIFLVMGSIWSFDAVFCWFYNTGEQAPWFIVILDCFMFLQAVAIFIIFCCNRRTLKHLEDKFPVFKRAFAPLKKILKIPENATDMTETTPNTPGGSRKVSVTSVSMSLERTLDRRKM